MSLQLGPSFLCLTGRVLIHRPRLSRGVANREWEGLSAAAGVRQIMHGTNVDFSRTYITDGDIYSLIHNGVKNKRIYKVSISRLHEQSLTPRYSLIIVGLDPPLPATGDYVGESFDIARY